MEATLDRIINEAEEGIDNKPLVDIVSGLIGLPAILVAHELGIFSLLQNQAMVQTEICQAKGISPRGASALLSMCSATGLLVKKDDKYHLTPLSRRYLLSDSQYYYGGFLDLLINNYESITYPSIRQAVLSDRSLAYEGDKDVFEVHGEHADRAAAFTRAMHSSSTGPAHAWVKQIDLSSYDRILDIGGGSGAHSIAALEQWQQLQATLLDLAPVCQVADEIAHSHNLSSRLTTQACNIWSDPFPSADIHFYSQIFHDWPEEKCLFLAKKSFQSLPAGGRIILHEVLYDDDMCGPFTAAANSVGMLLWTQGRQYSGHELSDMLDESGFVDVSISPTGFAYWSIVTARKE